MRLWDSPSNLVTHQGFANKIKGGTREVCLAVDLFCRHLDMQTMIAWFESKDSENVSYLFIGKLTLDNQTQPKWLEFSPNVTSHQVSLEQVLERWALLSRAAWLWVCVHQWLGKQAFSFSLLQSDYYDVAMVTLLRYPFAPLVPSQRKL